MLIAIAPGWIPHHAYDGLPACRAARPGVEPAPQQAVHHGYEALGDGAVVLPDDVQVVNVQLVTNGSPVLADIVQSSHYKPKVLWI